MPDVDPVLQQQVQDALGNAARFRGMSLGDISVAFHVITDGINGNVSDQMIYDQIGVLNAAYAGLGVNFNLASITRTDNALWYSVGQGTAAEDALKSALAVDPAHVINIYTANLGGGLVGWSSFPFDYPEADYRHGVVVLNESLPGGLAAPINEGDTDDFCMYEFTLGQIDRMAAACLTYRPSLITGGPTDALPATGGRLKTMYR